MSYFGVQLLSILGIKKDSSLGSFPRETPRYVGGPR